MDDVDVPCVRLREDVGYQKALAGVFGLRWTRTDEDVVFMELVKIDKQLDKNWWLTCKTSFWPMWTLSAVCVGVVGVGSTIF